MNVSPRVPMQRLPETVHWGNRTTNSHTQSRHRAHVANKIPKAVAEHVNFSKFCSGNLKVYTLQINFNPPQNGKYSELFLIHNFNTLKPFVRNVSRGNLQSIRLNSPNVNMWRWILRLLSPTTCFFHLLLFFPLFPSLVRFFFSQFFFFLVGVACS